MTEEKKLGSYNQFSQSRAKDINNKLDRYITSLKLMASKRYIKYCVDKSFQNGERDEINQKLCLNEKKQKMDRQIASLLPELSYHMIYYEQCLNECEQNQISYVIANQSCKGIYDKNLNQTLKKAAKKMTQI